MSTDSRPEAALDAAGAVDVVDPAGPAARRTR